jgi:hypothetical protein
MHIIASHNKYVFLLPFRFPNIFFLYRDLRRQDVLCRAVWQKFAEVSDVHTASIFVVEE